MDDVGPGRGVPAAGGVGLGAGFVGKAGPESKPGLVVVPGTIGPEIDSARVPAESEPSVPDVLPERRRGRSLFRRAAAQEEADRAAVPVAGPTDVRFLTFDRPEAPGGPARPGDPELDVDADLDRGADLDFGTRADRTAGLELSFTRDTDFGADPDRADELAPGPELFGLAALGLADSDDSGADEEWLADEDVPAAFAEEPEEELSGDFDVLDTDGAGTRSYLTVADASGGQWDDRSGRRYGDRVEGWVRPQYQEEPAAGDYWTPVPESYGWPVPIERLRQVPTYPRDAGSDTPDEIDAEATAIVPQWPPARTSDRIELPRSWSTRDPQARDPQARDPQARDPQARDPQARDPQDRDPQDRDSHDRVQRDRELQGRELQDPAQPDREKLNLEQQDGEQRGRWAPDRELSAGSLFRPAGQREATDDHEKAEEHETPDDQGAPDPARVEPDKVVGVEDRPSDHRSAKDDWRAADDEQEETARREANVRREEAIARREMDARQEEYDRQKERKLRESNLRGADRFRSQVEEAFFNTGASRRATVGREEGVGEGTRAIQIPPRAREARTGETRPSETRPSEAWVSEAREEDAQASEARAGETWVGEADAREARAGEPNVGEARSGVAQVSEAQADDISGSKPRAGKDPVEQDRDAGPVGDGDRSGSARRRGGLDGPIWLVPDLPDASMPDLSWAPGQSATPDDDSEDDEQESKRFRRPGGMMRRRRAASPPSTSASEATQALPSLESAPRPRPRPRPTVGQPEARSTVYVSKHAAEPT